MTKRIKKIKRLKKKEMISLPSSITIRLKK